MEKYKGYTEEDGIVYVQDPVSGHYTVFLARRPYVIAEDETKEKAKDRLMNLLDIFVDMEGLNR